MCKISVVTVVYNDVFNLESTIKSVLGQSYANIEYLIIDGLSNDGTVNIIEKYIERLATFISEKDAGIYDAMNKGMEKATGDWIVFLNSGDTFYDKNIIQNVANNYLSKKPCDVFYGDIAVRNKSIDSSYVIPAHSVDYLKKKMAMNHQSCFIKREVHYQSFYDLKYKIAADYHFFLKLYLGGKRFVYVPQTIAYIALGGVSDKNRMKVFKEVLSIKNELSPKFSNRLFYLKQVVYAFVADSLKTVIPKSLKVKLFKLKYNSSKASYI